MIWWIHFLFHDPSHRTYLRTTTTMTDLANKTREMAQQQQEVRQKNSSKKLKERKVPQRGLGVAQLERIRLESQKRTTTPPPPQSHSSCSAIQCPPPIFRHNSLPSPTTLSFPPPPPPPGNTILRRASSTPCIGFGHLHAGPVPFPRTADGGGGVVDKGWPVIANQPNHFLVTYHHPNMNLAYETCRPPNVIIQRPQQIQEQPMIVGMKRPYPFSLDPPSPSFPSKLPQMVAPSPKNPDDSRVPELGNLVFREGSSRSTPNPKENGKDIKDLNRDFLTLAPPRTVSPTLDNREILDSESSSVQGNAGDQDRPPGASESTHQLPFYSFFPPTKAQKREADTKSGGGSREVGEKLDLNLKL